MKVKGKVIKAVGGFFYVAHDHKVTEAKARKKLSYNNREIMVGDNVELSFDKYGKASVESLLPRRNFLTRPSVANVDIAVITIASLPAPDFVLVDKITLNCYIQNIRPVLAVNKSDINGKDFFEKICREYSDAVYEIISLSAEQDIGTDALKECIKGSTSVFCGQSAVGKTSLLNRLAEEAQKTGGLSAKSGRGKHTTRHSGIFDIGDDTYIVDTPGFSLLDIDIPSSELRLYYSDLVALQDKCKYHTCTHTTEPQCGVKAAVESGVFSRGRYQRYLAIYNELKEAEKNKF